METHVLEVVATPFLAEVVRTLLAKKPEDRYDSTDRLLEDLRRAESSIEFDTTAAVARLGQMVPDSLSGSTSPDR